jgi:hypothetical protein
VAGPGGADAILTYRTQITGEEGVSLGFRHLADSIDETDRSARRSSEGVTSLGQRLDAAKANVAGLKDEFNKTGDIRILKDIGKGERDVKNLTGWIRHLGDDSDSTSSKLGMFEKIVEAGAGGLVTFGSKASSAASAVSEYIIPVAAATAALFAVPIAAAAGGLAIAGVGGAFLAMGIKVAMGNAEVTDAAQRFGDTWHVVGNQATSMIAHELVPALGSMRDSLAQDGPLLEQLFIGPATAIGPLSAGLTGLVEHALPGLTDAADASSGVLMQIASALPSLGDTVGQFFSKIAEGAQGGGDALLVLIDLIKITVNELGNAIGGAEKLFKMGENTTIGKGVLTVIHALATVAPEADKASKSFKPLAVDTAATAAAAEKAASGYRSMADALGLVNGDSISAAQAQITSANATSQVSAAMKTAQGHIQGNSQASRDLRGQILTSLTTYAAQADAVFKVSGSTQQSTAAFYRQVEALRATTPAGSAARAQMDALINTFTRNRTAATASALSVGAINTEINRLHDKKVKAEAQADSRQVAALNAQINALHSKLVYVQVVAKYGGTAFGSADAAERAAQNAGITHRAGGGSAMAGRAYAVNEVGGEMFVPNTNGQIITAADLKGMSGGGGTVNVTINMAAGADPNAVVAAIQRYAQRNNGIALRGGVRTV